MLSVHLFGVLPFCCMPPTEHSSTFYRSKKLRYVLDQDHDYSLLVLSFSGLFLFRDQLSLGLNTIVFHVARSCEFNSFVRTGSVQSSQ